MGVRTGAALIGVAAAAAAFFFWLDDRPERVSPVVSVADEVAAAQARVKELPRDAVSWRLLGVAYVERARLTGDPTFYPKAEGALRRSLKLGEEGGALAGLGMLANARHDFAAARAWGLEARRVNRYDAQVHAVLVDAYTQLGQMRRARSALQDMLDTKPGLAAYTRLAYDLEQRGKVVEAQTVLERALAEESSAADRAFCLHRLGELAWSTGRTSEAGSYFEKALAEAPSFALALSGRAKVRAASGRSDEALADYKRLVELAPAPEHILDYGEYLESLGRRTEADTQYRVLAAQRRLLEANGVTDDLTLGLFEADHGSPAQAVHMLEAEWKRRKHPLVADALAWSLHRAGRSQDALPLTRRATGTGWHNASFAFHRGEIERSLGLGDAYLRTALSTNPHFSPLWAPRARAALDGLLAPAPSVRPGLAAG